MRRISLSLLIAAGAVALAAGSASASVTVMGGGNARDCSLAAFRGETSYRFEALCTQALETELLSARDRAGTLVNRGVFKLRRNEYEKANGDFNRAVQLQPKLGEAYVNRGAAAIGAKRYADGLADLNKAIEFGIEEPEKAYYNRALAFEGLDDLKAAYFDYQKALELSPQWEPPRRELARFSVERR